MYFPSSNLRNKFFEHSANNFFWTFAALEPPAENEADKGDRQADQGKHSDRDSPFQRSILRSVILFKIQSHVNLWQQESFDQFHMISNSTKGRTGDRRPFVLLPLDQSHPEHLFCQPGEPATQIRVRHEVRVRRCEVAVEGQPISLSASRSLCLATPQPLGRFAPSPLLSASVSLSLSAPQPLSVSVSQFLSLSVSQSLSLSSWELP